MGKTKFFSVMVHGYAYEFGLEITKRLNEGYKLEAEYHVTSTEHGFYYHQLMVKTIDNG